MPPEMNTIAAEPHSVRSFLEIMSRAPLGSMVVWDAMGSQTGPPPRCDTGAQGALRRKQGATKKGGSREPPFARTGRRAYCGGVVDGAVVGAVALDGGAVTSGVVVEGAGVVLGAVLIGGAVGVVTAGGGAAVCGV